MEKAKSDSRANSMSETEPRLYPPSWIDRFNAWLHRLRGPSWLYYLGLGLAILLTQAGLLVAEGVRPIGTFIVGHAFLAGMLVLFPALLHYLDDAADAALTALLPALKTDDETFRTLRYRLTELPSLPTLLTSAIAAITIVVINESLGTPVSFNRLASFPISSAVLYATYVVTWWVWGAFVYHTIHQLCVINRIYTEHTRVNLFRSRPLYAFSSATAVTAVSLTIPTYVWLAINQSMRDPIAIAITLPITALALVAFIWPQLGIHRLQVAEKARLLDEASQRFEAAIIDLHRRVDDGDLDGMSDLSEAIASLEIEKNALQETSTWPWQPDTVRWLLTALLLPLVLWLVQYLLQRVLGS